MQVCTCGRMMTATGFLSNVVENVRGWSLKASDSSEVSMGRQLDVTCGHLYVSECVCHWV
jgi:hypothetical protein